MLISMGVHGDFNGDLMEVNGILQDFMVNCNDLMLVYSDLIMI